MKRTTLIGLIAGGTLLVGALIALPFLLPEEGVELNQELPDGVMVEGDGMEPEVMTQRGGTWRDGDSFHKASGQISHVIVEGKEFLYFEDFDVTDGPDIYLYLTPSSNPSSTKSVEDDGVRINVITDEDSSSHINERGTFYVPVPAGVDVADYNAAVIWCDGANVLFGTATLG